MAYSRSAGWPDLGLLGALLRLRLAGLFARRLAGGRCGEFAQPSLEQRGPRLGKAQGAIAVDALLGIIPADVVALAGEAVLIANQVGRLRAVGGAVLDRAHRLGHRLLRLGAFLGELGGVADQRGAVGAPKAAGTGLAIGGLEDACGDLRRRQHGAVEHVERERAGRDVGLESLQPVGASGAGRLNRILADDIDDAALRGIRDALAGKLQLVDRRRLVIAGNLQQPRLAVKQKRAPGKAGDAGRSARLHALRAGSHALGGARASGLGGGGRRPLRRGRSRAREHQLRAGLARRESRGDEAARQEAKPSSHWPSLEAFSRKGKALGGSRQRAQGLKNPPLPRLARPNRPTYIRPDWQVRAQMRAEPAEIWPAEIWR